jgi:zinc transport system substrate-binding protein
MSVTYLYHCPHCQIPFNAFDDEVSAMGEGLQHYHSTGHEIGEIRHFDGSGESDGELYAGDHVHTQHVNHHETHGHHEHGHHEHGHHEHGHHEHGHHEHGHDEHGHHEEPHIF